MESFFFSHYFHFIFCSRVTFSLRRVFPLLPSDMRPPSQGCFCSSPPSSVSPGRRRCDTKAALEGALRCRRRRHTEHAATRRPVVASNETSDQTVKRNRLTPCTTEPWRVVAQLWSTAPPYDSQFPFCNFGRLGVKRSDF